MASEKKFFCLCADDVDDDLLEEVLRSGPQHQLLVDLHVELGPLGLQFPAACCGSGI